MGTQRAGRYDCQVERSRQQLRHVLSDPQLEVDGFAVELLQLLLQHFQPFAEISFVSLTRRDPDVPAGIETPALGLDVFPGRTAAQARYVAVFATGKVRFDFLR